MKILSQIVGSLATATQAGLVKPGVGLTVASDGTLNASTATTGAFNLTTRLPSPSSSTKGVAYVLDKGGTATDEIYVGVGIAGSGYRWLRLPDGALFSSVKPSTQVLKTTSTYATGLRCFLPMNESSGTTVHDISGNALNATLQTNATWGSDTDGAAVVTTTSTGGITLAASTLGSSTTAVTIALRVDFVTAQSGVLSLFEFNKDSSNRIVLFPARGDVTGNNYDLIVQDTAHGRIDQEVNPGVGTGTHDVALVLDGTNAKLYIDGSFVGTTATAVTPATIGTIVTAALSYGPSGSPLAGKFSCFAVWTSAFTATKLQGFFANPYDLIQ